MELQKSMYHRLGRTNILVSPIALGCWQYSKDSNFIHMDDQESMNLIRSAIDMGVNFFDTAESYGEGHSEQILGQAVRESGKEVVIASKVSASNLEPQNIMAAVELSLTRLKRETIDLYLIHWPTHKVDLRIAIETLTKLKEQGKIRAIGVSNFSMEEIKLARDSGEIAALQSPYNLLWRCLEDEFSYCHDHEISILAYSPLAQGLLTGVYDRIHRQPKRPSQADNYLFQEPYYEMAVPVLEAVNSLALKYERTPAEVALAWLLGKKAVGSVIVGATNRKQLTANVHSVSLRISQADIDILESAGEPLLESIQPQMKKSLWNWWPDKDDEKKL